MSSRTILVYASEWNGLKELAQKTAREISESLGLAGDKAGAVYSKNDKIILQVWPFSDINRWLYDSLSWSGSSQLLLLIGTSESGSIAPSCAAAMEELRAFAHDPRADPRERQKISYNVIGYGDMAYGGESFCRPAIEINKCLKLGNCKRQERLFNVDASSVDATAVDVAGKFKWFANAVQKAVEGLECSSGDDSEEDVSSDGGSVDGASVEPSSTMLSTSQREVLLKQGYKVIGTHSAVKMCRWTKHQLRAQGGCYKHTFYGIQSHRCMETTCCLACANKCVFCWRHQKNPVTKEWKWEMDDPEWIVDQALEAQRKMVGIFKGAKGVLETGRLQEGMEVAHCALSLVGEPILYPRINDLLIALHARRISTFLVNNGQFPEQIAQLTPCTQLYVSVDASDPRTMKELDRPLFADYWERFLRSLAYLKKRHERTVYRLTIVKDRNEFDLDGYAKLVPLGMPDLIELKGVTFTGKGCGIRMTNVPTHEEVVEFAHCLVNTLDYYEETRGIYGIAVEHEHSCSVLLAKNKYHIDGNWHTWIDYPKFFEWEMLAREALKNNQVPPSNVHYACPTPDWALFGADEKGFDPDDQRKYRKNRLLMMDEDRRNKIMESQQQRRPKGCTDCSCP